MNTTATALTQQRDRLRGMVAVVPLAPAYVIARAVEMLYGEKNRFPSSARSCWWRASENPLLPSTTMEWAVLASFSTGSPALQLTHAPISMIANVVLDVLIALSSQALRILLLLQTPIVAARLTGVFQE